MNAKLINCSFLLGTLLIAQFLEAQQASTAARVPAAVYDQAQQARRLRLEGNAADSAKMLGSIATAHPDYFFAQYNLGLAYQGKGDVPAAISALQKAKEIKEKDRIQDATIYNSLGWVYLDSGDYSQALREFKTAEKPENFAALTPSSQRKLLNNIAVTYAYSGEAKLANEYFVKAKKVPTRDLQAEQISPAK